MVRTKQATEREKAGKVGMTAAGKVFGLTERTALFGEAVIRFAKGLRRDPVSKPLISQLVRSSTSIGANWMEVGAAQSCKNFDHKIGICKKEARETMHLLRMLAAADTSSRADCRALWREAHELSMTFSAILKKRRAGVET